MHTLRRPAIVVAAVALAAAMIGGCGGTLSSTPRMEINGMGTLTDWSRLNPDGSWADVVQFRTTRSGYVEIMMERAGFAPVADPYVEIWQGTLPYHDETTFIGWDYDSGGYLNARFVFEARRNTWYSVMFTTVGADDFGTYRYVIRELVGHVAAADVTAAAADPDRPAKDAARKPEQ